MIVQGDVFFLRANEMPSGAKQKEKNGKGFIIAEGETTGHAHVAIGELEMYEKNGTLYLKVHNTIPVTHEEHKPVYLDEGIWKVGIVREYDYLENGFKDVPD